MNEHYYNSQDLKNFAHVADSAPDLGKKFFDYYKAVFEAGALSSREKALIALAVAHAVQCPYCIDAYSTASLEKGSNEEQMMEAVHVATAIRAGACLIHGTQMMKHVKKVTL